MVPVLKIVFHKPRGICFAEVYMDKSYCEGLPQTKFERCEKQVDFLKLLNGDESKLELFPQLEMIYRAIKNKDMKMCGDGLYSDECRMIISKDKKYCKTIGCLYTGYKLIAILEDNSTYCNMIPNLVQKNYCKAIVEKNSTLCHYYV